MSQKMMSKGPAYRGRTSRASPFSITTFPIRPARPRKPRALAQFSAEPSVSTTRPPSGSARANQYAE